jgi:four helix bundle protein
MSKNNWILDASFEFSLEMVELYKEMIKNKEYIFARQLLKSATSIGANVEEAMAGQSRKDFISKMSIASKEARETRYWLRLLDKSQLVYGDYAKHLASIEHIVNVLTKIIKTSQQPIQNIK